MQRDMDVIRSILISLAEDDPKIMPDVGAEVTCTHIEMMIDAGFIEGRVHRRQSEGYPTTAEIRRVTWAGYEFLGSCRDEGLWLRAKELLKSIGGAAAFDVWVSVLTEVAKSQLRMCTGK